MTDDATLDCAPAIVAAMRNRCKPSERVQYGWYDGEFVITRGIAGEIVEMVTIKPKEERHVHGHGKRQGR